MRVTAGGEALQRRAAAVLLTIDATLTGAGEGTCLASCGAWRWLRRILANVFLRSVLKLAV